MAERMPHTSDHSAVMTTNTFHAPGHSTVSVYLMVDRPQEVIDFVTDVLDASVLLGILLGYESSDPNRLTATVNTLRRDLGRGRPEFLHDCVPLQPLLAQAIEQ